MFASEDKVSESPWGGNSLMGVIVTMLADFLRCVRRASAAICLFLFRLVNSPTPLGPRPRLVVAGTWSVSGLEEFLCEVTKVHQAFSAEVVVLVTETPSTALLCLILLYNIRYFFNFFLYPDYLAARVFDGWGSVRLFALQDLQYIFTRAPWDVSHREGDALVLLNDRYSQDQSKADAKVVDICVKLRAILPDTRFVVQVLLQDTVCRLRHKLCSNDTVICLEQVTDCLLSANAAAPGAASALTSLLCVPDAHLFKSVFYVPDPPMWRRFTGQEHFRLLIDENVTSESESFWDLASRCYLGCQTILLGYRREYCTYLLPDTVPAGSHLIYFGDLLKNLEFLHDSFIAGKKVADEDHPKPYVALVPAGNPEAIARLRSDVVNNMSRHSPQDATSLVVCPRPGAAVETTVADYYRALTQFKDVDPKPNISVSMWSMTDHEMATRDYVDPALLVLATATTGHSKPLYDAWTSLLQDLDIVQIDINCDSYFWNVFQQLLQRGMVTWALAAHDAHLVPAPHCNHQLHRGDAVCVFSRKKS